MTAKLHVIEPNLTATRVTGKNSVIISPDCFSSRARSRSFGAAPALMPPRRFPSDVD